MSEDTKQPQWVRAGSFEDPFKQSLNNMLTLLAQAVQNKVSEVEKTQRANRGCN